MPDNVNETPTLAQILQQVVESRLCEVHTCMPAEVVKFDSSTQKAEVKPLLKRKYANGSSVELPNIKNVPVIMPRAGKAWIHFPLKAGHIVTLHFSERSLDKWKNSGGVQDPSTENRKHALSDAYAVPGGYPFNDTVEGSDSDLLIVNDKSQIVVKTGGQFRIEKKGGDELIDLLGQVVELLSTTTTNTIFGPLQLNDFAQFKQLATKIKKLKG